MGRRWPFDYEDRVRTFLRLFQLATVVGALAVLAIVVPKLA